MKLSSIPKSYLWLLLFYFVIGTLLWVKLPQGEIELWINQHRFLVADVFFLLWTWWGDGWGATLVVLVALLFSYRIGVVMAVALIFQMLCIHTLKLWVFPDSPRPKLFFEIKGISLNFVSGIEVHSYHSFPSGHTGAAFTLALILAYFLGLQKGNQMRKELLAVCLLLSAILVGISRLYLLQHFLKDTLAGAAIASASTLLVLSTLEKYTQKWKGGLCVKA